MILLAAHTLQQARREAQMLLEFLNDPETVVGLLADGVEPGIVEEATVTATGKLSEDGLLGVRVR